MANISIFDLQPAGSGFFSDSESFFGSMQDLSENELKMTLGGKKSKKSSKSSSSKSSSSQSGSCNCYCSGGNHGNSGGGNGGGSN